jgi:hypothetical protein
MASEEIDRTAEDEGGRRAAEPQETTRRELIRKLGIAGGAMALFPLVESGLSPAAAQSVPPVTIIYPFNGAVYPNVDIVPHGTVNSYYLPASFAVGCGGGPISVEWGFDGSVLGTATCYDQMTVQLVQKLPGGKHTFTVKTSCGSASVDFVIG